MESLPSKTGNGALLSQDAQGFLSPPQIVMGANKFKLVLFLQLKQIRIFGFHLGIIFFDPGG